MSKIPEYDIWISIKARCVARDRRTRRNYLDRGITVCQRWAESFETFLADMGPRPTPQHTIERRNGSLGYQPDNCCWATRLEQAHNMRTNRHLTHDGKTMTITEWARSLGTDCGTLSYRLRAGWSVEQALTTPVRHGNRIRQCK
jgi:hypothetical protein